MKNQSMVKKEEEKILSLDCMPKLEMQNQEMTSKQLSKNLIMQMMSLIENVNKKEITPETVKASCMCAEQVYKILKLNLEIKKNGF